MDDMQRSLLPKLSSFIVVAETCSQGIQSRDQLRTWLAPPNFSINHNTACGTQHDGTTKWFIEGGAFDEWKKNGSLLWIRGNRMLPLP